jgi:hypothetical protein
LHLADDIESVAEDARAEKQRVAQLEDEWDTQEATMRELKSRLPALKAAIVNAADTWKAKDPASFIKWEKQVANAFKCSTALSRNWQIAYWIKIGVPQEVIEAVYDLAVWYSDEAVVKYLIESLQLKIGFDISQLPYEEECKDDDCWVAHRWLEVQEEEHDPAHIFIGTVDDVDESIINGFANYVPKGEHMAMLQHLSANIQARKSLVASNAAVGPGFPEPILSRAMIKFIESAVFVLDQEQAMIGGPTPHGSYFDAISNLRTALLDMHRVLTKYKDEGIRAYANYSPLPDDKSEDGSGDDDDEDEEDDADDGDSGSEQFCRR